MWSDGTVLARSDAETVGRAGRGVSVHGYLMDTARPNVSQTTARRAYIVPPPSPRTANEENRNNHTRPLALPAPLFTLHTYESNLALHG